MVETWLPRYRYRYMTLSRYIALPNLLGYAPCGVARPRQRWWEVEARRTGQTPAGKQLLGGWGCGWIFQGPEWVPVTGGTEKAQNFKS